MKQRDGDEAPADHAHRLENPRRAGVDDEIGGEREAQESRGIERDLDGADPLSKLGSEARLGARRGAEPVLWTVIAEVNECPA
jgi:hypothetical protein